MYMKIKYDGSEADFFLNKHLKYTSRQLEKKGFWCSKSLPSWELCDVGTKEPIARLDRIDPKGWFAVSTLVEIGVAQTTAQFKSHSKPACHYTAQYEDDRYLVIPHKGLKHSIFKNGQQVGYWIKDYITYEWSFVIHAYMDEDADLECICQLIAAKIILNPESNDSNVSIDFGNLGSEMKPFDKAWKPKEL